LSGRSDILNFGYFYRFLDCGLADLKQSEERVKPETARLDKLTIAFVNPYKFHARTLKNGQAGDVNLSDRALII